MITFSLVHSRQFAVAVLWF